MADNLHKAKNEKFDEFYTEFSDIQKEINAYLEYNPEVFKNKIVLLPCDDPEWSNFTKFFAQNFERFGLKKLISTSYSLDKKQEKYNIVYQLSLFETESPKFNEKKTKSHGKIFTLEKDENNSGKVDIEDLKWDYLEGDGDFRSAEVKKLRDEADIIVTNPPFSLFREFLNWILEANKNFIIIGNENDASGKDLFPLMYEGKIWIGKNCGDMSFKVPKDAEARSTRFWIDESGQKWRSMGNICWYTNIDLGRRHQPLQLMTMADNLKFNKNLIKKLNNDYGVNEYPKLDNYDAIEVPRYDSIPSDYKGIMAVPVTFLKYHDPEQFKLLGCTQRDCHPEVPDTKKYNDYLEMTPDGKPTGSNGGKTNENANMEKNDGKHNYFINKDGHIVQSLYGRVFIRFMEEYKNENNIEN